MNLIPEKPGVTPNYWCTWATQNYSIGRRNEENCNSSFDGDQGVLTGRDNLNEKVVFENPGWAHHFFTKVKADMYLMFDDGWDVPYGVDPSSERWRFGSLELHEERFPSCSGCPGERLRKLNERVKESGWRGAGLWVAAQAKGEGKGRPEFTEEELEAYWRERVRWCAYAGIEYWKVDWGYRCGNIAFRRMMSRVAKEEYPQLIIEHCKNCGPLNDEEMPWDHYICTHSGRFANWDKGSLLGDSVELLTFSSILRTYDVANHTSPATTLDRMVQILSDEKINAGVEGILNCEDELYLGAALGTAVGVMRHPLWREEKGVPYDPYQYRKRIDEVFRALRWQRISPAFNSMQAKILLSDLVLWDVWKFVEGNTWATWYYGREIHQGAPGIAARGMDLPQVIATGEVPFVVASRNPNGAYSVATLPRTSIEKGIYMPLAKVIMEVEDILNPVGIFGEYEMLTLKVKKAPQYKKVWAQDLAGDKAIDITSKVRTEGNSILLEGSLLREVGLSEATQGDVSGPGLILAFM